MSETNNILLVEDNVDHAALIIRCLKKNKWVNRLDHVCDGDEALKYLYNQKDLCDPCDAPKPQLILLDLRLPKVSGLEVLKEIKSNEYLRMIPVVVLSTSNAEQDIAQAYDYHANSYLVKPLDFSAFSQLMDGVATYWLSVNYRAP